MSASEEQSNQIRDDALQKFGAGEVRPPDVQRYEILVWEA
jgi:hypothetical protein